MKNQIPVSLSTAVLWVALSLGFISPRTSAHTQIFPLQRGLHYVYLYKNVSANQDVGYYETWVDSGIVRYTVIDSIGISDTCATWNVLQTYHLLHRYHNNFGRDTLYWYSDSTVFQLNEVTIGFHELRGSSRVWQFPITFPLQPGHPVFRFADSSQVRVTFHFNVPGLWGGGDDSLWFSQESGFYKRHRVWSGGGGMTSGSGELTLQLSGPPIVSVQEGADLPTRPLLQQNYPNPFNPSTTIRFWLLSKAHVHISVFDFLGREVSILHKGDTEPGTHIVQWKASAFASGVYYYRIQAGGWFETKKMVLLK